MAESSQRESSGFSWTDESLDPLRSSPMDPGLGLASSLEIEGPLRALSTSPDLQEPLEAHEMSEVDDFQKVSISDDRDVAYKPLKLPQGSMSKPGGRTPSSIKYAEIPERETGDESDDDSETRVSVSRPIQNMSNFSATNGGSILAGNFHGNITLNGNSFSSKSPEELERSARHALFLTDPDLDRESVKDDKGERVPGTCEWVRKHELFEAWYDGDSSRLLWISGGPGTGKTMLSLFLAEELEKRCTAKAGSAPGTLSPITLFYFCTYQQENRRTAVGVLRSLCYQLITKRPQLARYAIEVLNTSDKLKDSALTEQGVWSLFEKMIQDPNLGRAFFVLDGLDECDPASSERLIKRFSKLFDPSQHQSRAVEHDFRLVIVSRDLPGLHQHPRLNLDTSGETIQGDLSHFVSNRMEELTPTLTGEFDDEFLPWLKNTLLERAQGTFLWLGYAVDELLRIPHPTERQIKLGLQRVPRGLDRIYQTMMRVFECEFGEDSSITLQWIVQAFRPLTVKELTAAISLRSQDGMSAEQVLLARLQFCSTWIKLEGEGDDTSKTVKLIHLSAKDHILNTQGTGELRRDGHARLAEMCLSFLEKSPLQYRDTMSKEDFSQWPFLEYSAYNWVRHARHSQSKAFFERRRAFFDIESTIFDNWLRAMNRRRDPRAGYQSFPYVTSRLLNLSKVPTEDPAMIEEFAMPTNRLSLACGFDLSPWAELLLEDCSTKEEMRSLVNEIDETGGTPLFWAVHVSGWDPNSGGNLVVTLLRSGAIPDQAIGPDGSFALHHAAWKGKALVGLLLDHGASVKVRLVATPRYLRILEKANHPALDIVEGRTPLWYATMAYTGGDEILQLLLARGGDGEDLKKERGHALTYAAFRGNLAIVQRLQRCGVDMEARDPYGYNAVLAAARSGSKGAFDIMELLLESGFDAEASIQGLTALHFTAMAGDLKLVKLILEHGVRADLPAGGDSMTAMMLAAEVGHFDVMKCLLDHGADLTTESENKMVALHFAARGGALEAAKLLLDNGANIEQQAQNGSTSLFFAARNGHLNVVQLLLDRGADINRRNATGSTCLFNASEKGHVDVVKLLLDNGADANSQDSDGSTALLLAAMNGHADVIELLLVRVDDLERQDNFGWTALLLAAQQGHTTVVRLFLTREANDKHQSENGLTGLIVAAQNGHAEIANIFLERGANIEHLSESKTTALISAAERGHLPVARLLLENGAKVDHWVNLSNTEVPDHWTPLSYAALNGHTELVGLLLDNGAEIEHKSSKGYTPLAFAAVGGHVETFDFFVGYGANELPERHSALLLAASENGHAAMVRVLLARGADIEGRGENGVTALATAARLGHVEVIKVLLEHGADFASRDDYGHTPLSLASWFGRSVEAIQILLKSGADIESREKTGRTPLYIASQYGQTGVAQLLLVKGANIETRQNGGWTPLHTASRNGHTEIARLLLEHGANIEACEVAGWTPLHIASRQGQTEVVCLLLERGANIEACEEEVGWTSLHIASRHGQIEVVCLLLEQGASIEARTKKGWTPLHHASNNCRIEVVELLVQRGAKPDARNTLGFTPLHMAAELGHTAIAKLLLEQGASIEVRSANKSTPLIVASRCGQVEMVKLLLDLGADIHAVGSYSINALSTAKENKHSEVKAILEAELLKPEKKRTRKRDMFKDAFINFLD